MIKEYNNQEDFLKDCVNNEFITEDDLVLNFDLISYNISITAGNIKAKNIYIGSIFARNIKAINIKSWFVKANYIEAQDVSCDELTANKIIAQDIVCAEIDVNYIKYYAVCIAYFSFKCISIIPIRDNHKHCCLDNKIIIKE